MPRENRPAVLILAPDAGEYLPLLEDLAAEGVELTAAESPDEARRAWSGQPVVLGQPDWVATLLGEMPGVRWVQSSWAGVRPLLELSRSDYMLTAVKGVFGAQMAEYVMGYLLAHELRIAERLGRQANRDWWPEASGTLRGKTLGIMGTGSIGSHVARMAAPFGMKAIGFSRSGAPVEGFEKVFASDRLHDFLALPDYLVSVLPDTPETRHLLDAEAFRVMPDHCYLVNVGRGSVIDEAALAGALSARELVGGVLDVFEREPLPEDSPLWAAPGLVVTGHVAAKSWPEDIARIFRENYRRYCGGKPLKYRVDLERGY